MAKQSVTLDVLSYHASASLDDAKRLQVGYIRNLVNKLITYQLFFVWFGMQINNIVLFFKSAPGCTFSTEISTAWL